MLVHSAVWNLHPTCEYCLAGAHNHQTQADGKCSRATGQLKDPAPKPDWRSLAPRAGSAVGPTAWRPASARQSSPRRRPCPRPSPWPTELARLVLLACGGVEVGQIKLRHGGRNRLRGLGGQRIVEIDGLRRRAPSGDRAWPAPAWPGWRDCGPTSPAAAFSSVSADAVWPSSW